MKPLSYRYTVASLIVSRIQSGEYKPGDRIPTHRELGEHLYTSHRSVQEGYEILKHLGLVWSKTYRGTFVANNPPEIPEDLLTWFKETWAKHKVDYKSK